MKLLSIKGHNQNCSWRRCWKDRLDASSLPLSLHPPNQLPGENWFRLGKFFSLQIFNLFKMHPDFLFFFNLILEVVPSFYSHSLVSPASSNVWLTAQLLEEPPQALLVYLTKGMIKKGLLVSLQRSIFLSLWCLGQKCECCSHLFQNWAHKLLILKPAQDSIIAWWDRCLGQSQ